MQIHFCAYSYVIVPKCGAEWAGCGTMMPGMRGISGNAGDIWNIFEDDISRRGGHLTPASPWSKAGAVSAPYLGAMTEAS